MVVQSHMFRSLFVLIVSLLFSGVVAAACTANINMNNKKITHLADPVNDNDAVTKAYVDSKGYYFGRTWTNVNYPAVTPPASAWDSAWQADIVTFSGGNDLDCDTINKRARCTVKFDGALSVKVKVASDGTGTCRPRLTVNGVFVDQIQARSQSSNNASTASTGFVTIVVNNNDKIVLGTNVDNERNCSTSPQEAAGFQFVRLR